jgi:hypothetical protein
MTPPIPTPARSVGSLLRSATGLAISAGFALAALVAGFDMGREGGGVFAWLGVSTGALLVISAWRNWPVLWNALGRLLRRLLGEPGARLALGCMGACFALGVMAGAL